MCILCSVSSVVWLWLGANKMATHPKMVLATRTAISLSGLNETGTASIYSGPTSEHHSLYDDNFQFFLHHGLPSSGGRCIANDLVIIVLTRETYVKYRDRLTLHNTTCGELHVVIREDRCYDMESARVVFCQHSHYLMGKQFVIFLNCGLVGPLYHISGNSDPFWALSFTNLIDSTVKLAGLTINCGGPLGISQAHVQSMLWCTDMIGLSHILNSDAIYACGDQLTNTERHPHGRAELIVRYELGLSRAIMSAGFGIRPHLTVDGKEDAIFTWNNASSSLSNATYPPLWCRDVWWKGLEEKLHPEDALFWKVSRHYPNEVAAHVAKMSQMSKIMFP